VVTVVRKSLKAALLSALVFPGAGHFSLHKPVQGALISAVAFVCLYFLLTTAVDIAQQLSVKLQKGEVPFDVAKIDEMVAGQLAAGEGSGTNIASLLLLVCWLVGIVDSFRIGWLQDRSEHAANKKKQKSKRVSQ
jgi:hypothetical protein